jgi:endonuclease/exonuclease/phosphatase family metal-dependent hydrolase
LKEIVENLVLKADEISQYLTNRNKMKIKEEKVFQLFVQSHSKLPENTSDQEIRDFCQEFFDFYNKSVKREIGGKKIFYEFLSQKNENKMTYSQFVNHTNGKLKKTEEFCSFVISSFNQWKSEIQNTIPDDKNVSTDLKEDITIQKKISIKDKTEKYNKKEPIISMELSQEKSKGSSKEIIQMKEKLLSFNVSYQNEKSTPNSQNVLVITTFNICRFDGSNKYRLKNVINAILESNSTMVHIQEASDKGINVITDYLNQLSKTKWKHCTSENTGTNNERFAILYQESKFNLVKSTLFNDNSKNQSFKLMRSVFISTFKCVGRDLTFQFLNAHLSWTDREFECSRLLDGNYLEQFDKNKSNFIPILLGDWNMSSKKSKFDKLRNLGWVSMNSQFTNLLNNSEYDCIWVEKIFVENIRDSFVTIPMDSDVKKYEFSDHVPLSVIFDLDSFENQVI